jgi:hypothetical protein
VEKHQLHEEDDTTRLYVFKSIPERAEVSYRPGVLGSGLSASHAQATQLRRVLRVLGIAS